MRKFVIFCVMIYWSQLSSAQLLSRTYAFDQCNGKESSAISEDALIPGGTSCECGISGKAIELNTDGQFITLPNSNNKFFESKNMTLDFYFTITNTSGEVEILSIKNGCNSLDSIIRVRYFANSEEVIFDLASNINNLFKSKFKLNRSTCWHRLTLVKFDLEYFLYYNGKQVDKYLAKENIGLKRNSTLLFGGSECTGASVVDLLGRIDQIYISNEAWSPLDVAANDYLMDAIKTETTTIFKGDDLQLEIGETCAPLISWTPVASLDNANISNPIASPEETTTYAVTLDNGWCKSKDEITVYVTDLDNLDCSKLLLPKAFTPNNDGLNETYFISNKFIVQELKYFDIYARDGSKVWETKDINDAWDGRMRDGTLLNGTYVYSIGYTCQGKDYSFIDNFLLLK
jgi:gliding motility-associated-like protein